MNADEWKSIEFDSTKVEARGKDELEVTGDLRLHGVKKSVTAHVKQIGYAEKTMMGARIGFETTLQLAGAVLPAALAGLIAKG